MLGPADDVDMVSRTFGTVVEHYTRVKCEAERLGLKINASKTKYMLAGGSEHDRAWLGCTVRIDGDEFEVNLFIFEIVYLTDNNGQCTIREIRKRIVNRSRA